MNNLIIFAAQYLILLPIGTAIYLLASLPKPKRLDFLKIIVIAGILAFLLSKLGNHLYSSLRPFYVDHVTPLFSAPKDNGFPSDHTLLSAYLAFSCLVFSKRLGLLLICTAIIIGTARVAANVHHGIDVIGGVVFAALAVRLSLVLVRKIFKHST